MPARYQRRNLTFPPGLLAQVVGVLREKENVSSIVSDFLKRFVASRRRSPKKK